MAKGLLPYHGLGSGIKRAVEKWPAIDFADDHDGCLFTATVHRMPVEELELADKGAISGQVAGLSGHPDPINNLLTVLRTDPSADYATLAERLEVSEATVKRNIQKLKQQNRFRGRRAGQDRGGFRACVSGVPNGAVTLLRRYGVVGRRVLARQFAPPLAAPIKDRRKRSPS
ncbi:MAG: HTH domain-containing protein [Thermodesulfobacteriota bacterium]